MVEIRRENNPPSVPMLKPTPDTRSLMDKRFSHSHKWWRQELSKDSVIRAQTKHTNDLCSSNS